MIKVIYQIPAPYSADSLQVFYSMDNRCFEFCVCRDDDIVFSTASENGGNGRQYGNAEIALRDALIYATRPLSPDALDVYGRDR